MGQSPLEQMIDLEHNRKGQSGIFLNQGVYFEYTQLLPGVEMFQLILGARGAPLMDNPFVQNQVANVSLKVITKSYQTGV